MIFDEKQQEGILPLVLLAAERAAEKILDIYENPDRLVVEEKWDGSYVTNADILSQVTIESLLPPHLTGAPIISEENNNPVPANGGPHFLIDPLDGTSRFIKSAKTREGERGFINIALVEQGIPRLAVIYNLTERDVFVTHEGLDSFVIPSLADAWANVNQTGVSFEKAVKLQIREPFLKGDRLNVSFNAKRKTDQRYSGIQEYVRPGLNLPDSHIVADTLIGVRSLLRGQIDVAIRSNPHWESGYPHDIAPWWLLTKNAGGETVFLGNKPTTAANFSDRDTRMPGLIAMHRDTAQPFMVPDHG